MALEYKKYTFLKIYTGEDVMLDDEPMYKTIIRESRRLGLAGGTVVKAIAGYASQMRGRMGKTASYFISGGADAPIIIEIVDTRENIEKILPFLEKNAKDSLVTIEETEVLMTDYLRWRMAQKMTQQNTPQPQRQSEQQQQ